MRILLLASTLVLASASGVARADAVRDALEDLVKCADLADPAKRLECFDRAAAHGKAALATPLAPAPSAQPTKEKSLLEWFGLSKPAPVTKAEDFGKPPPGPEVTQISETVLEFGKTARGKAVFILANGQVWRQIDGDSTDVPPPAPGSTMKVTVETGLFGSYNLTIDGRNGLIKVNRIR